MNTHLIIILTGLAIALLSFSGALLAFKKINTWFSQNIKLLVTFAAGVFVMTSFSLMSETFEFLSKNTALFSIIGGFLGMLILHKIIPETHHHHDNECATCIPQKSGPKLLIGDIIHNIADGIVLVAAFSVSKEVGILATVSIAIHEFIQEISEYIVLRNSGYSNKKTLLLNFISSLSIFIGVFIGIYLTQDTALQAILLGISAGAFLHIVFHDLIPYNSMRKIHKKQSWNYIGVFFLGIILMITVGFSMPHTHEHAGTEHHHDEHEIEIHTNQEGGALLEDEHNHSHE